MKDIILTQTTKEDLVDEITERLTTVIKSELAQQTQKSLDNKEYLTRKEVAKLLKVSLPTVHTWTHKKGILRSQKIGRRVLYLKSEVLEAMQSVESLNHLITRA